MMKRIVCLWLVIVLGVGPELTQAQQFKIDSLPIPGTIVPPSPAFNPVLIKGMVIDPAKPFNIRFIIDSGNNNVSSSNVKAEGERMVRYFLAAVAVPEKDLWVNLSPYEHDRMIEDALGQTDLGRDMLAQDYILKQISASVMDPEKNLGKDFWDKVYAKAQAEFGTTDIPVDAFNKVWITPENVEVFERGNAVYVTQAHLKLMLDSDYTAQQQGGSVPAADMSRELSKQVFRDVLLPALEREVNEGMNFGVIRQIFYAVILAKWYREAVKDTLMATAYVGQKKIAGVDLADKTITEQIYQRYLDAYKKGVINMVKETPDPVSGESVSRHYLSGGEKFDALTLKKGDNSQVIPAPEGRVFVINTAVGIVAESSVVDREASVEIAPVTTAERVDEILAVHNEAWETNPYLQFDKALFLKFIQNKMVYVLQDKDAGKMIRGVLLTYSINSSVKPVWDDIVSGKTSQGLLDMVLFWAIGVPQSKRKKGEKLPQIFARLADAYFKGRKMSWDITYSPIAQKKYEDFIQGLKDSGLADDVIKEHGIYLYLASTPGQGLWPYVKYIKENGFVSPEQFFTKNGIPFIDGVEGFHVPNGARIGAVIPSKKGVTRPDGDYTIEYYYTTPEGVLHDDKGFRALANVPVPDDAQVIPGGVAIQNIALTAQGGGLRLILDDAAIEALTSDTFSGLTPSVVSVRAIASPQAGLGIK